MSTIQTIAENYQSFNPRAYLQNNYIPPRADFDNPGSVVPWKLRCLADACASGEIGGQLMVDIGTGPTVYQLLSAFELFKEVVLTDYLEVNRDEIRKWLRGETGTFDWGPYIKHVCNIEGKGLKDPRRGSGERGTCRRETQVGRYAGEIRTGMVGIGLVPLTAPN
ncbi:phenylethanolamine N-methyltransferase [Pelobates cultripes]|uniref:Phenylethanolamine N-methyltransferase n=1 Tax=Pelobates cultripes TaxID=61616 RepID=A0AAD1SJN1_PELCU|nr:phenylethanolamine N-methyltransferase [Pelobates cultripes]